MTYIQPDAEDEPSWAFDKIYRKLASLVKGNKVLDYGCGNCNLKRYLVEGKSYIGIDTDSVCEKSSRLIFPIETFRISNWTADTIVISNVLEHCENHVSLLRFLYSRLNENGRMIIVVPNILHWKKCIAGLIGKKVDCDKYHIHAFSTAEMQKTMIALSTNAKTSFRCIIFKYSGYIFCVVDKTGTNCSKSCSRIWVSRWKYQ